MTPEETTHAYAQNLVVSVTVQGVSSTPTGSVALSSGSFTTAAANLNNGSANFYIQPGALAQGADTLTATYTPDSSSSSQYSTATGTTAITITTPGKTNITVNIDTLANRHQISPYIYGINTANKNNISGMKPALVRWGGNQTSVYNWKLFTYNAGADWFFEDFGLSNTNGNSNDSVALTQYTMSQGSHMLTTMPMLNWVAAEGENSTNKHWSYSIAALGAQCSHDPYNADAGNGQKPDCKTPITTNAMTSAYYPLVDHPSDCTTGNCLFRSEWTAALSNAFGGTACNVPYTSITSCHFYDLDNEPEIWDGSHRDVHPVHPGYTELSDSFVKGATNLKLWDANAVRFGPVTCCWNFLWTAGPTGDDKNAHAGVDFIPWWLNQVNWLDQINGTRTLDVFDVHSYFGDNIDTNGFSNPQLRTEVNKYVRTYWDPTYANAGYDQDWITTTQPKRNVTFLIPRLKALVNAIYPGTPLSFSEWESFFNEWEFATALSDADAYGVMGREGLSFSTRWGGPDATDSTTNQPHPNYYSFQLYTNYDGAGNSFGSLSVSDQSNISSDVFVSYAALDASGTKLTIMVLNKDAGNDANVTFNLSGFNATSYSTYTVASTDPAHIITSSSTSWSATQRFAANSITLLVVNGNQLTQPASEWYLNPDDLMIPASGTGVLNPKIMSGTSNVTLSSAVFDAFEGAPACNGTLTLTNPVITPTTPATITVNPGSTQSFCHYTVTGNDGTSTQTQSGWIVVGQRAATFAKSGGDNQTANAGTTLPQALSVTLSNVPSGLSLAGASVLFTTSAGTVSNGITSGSKVIAITNSSGVASVTLTLPSTPGPVTITAKDQFAMGGTAVTFNQVAN
ncbi:MAG: glycoside hydrolase family 44 protein [Steroidobacter sp.]